MREKLLNASRSARGLGGLPGLALPPGGRHAGATYASDL
jgi:hypothetical protein